MTAKTDPRDQILTLLTNQPAHIVELTANLDEARLHAAPGPAEWSLNDILAHLRSCSDAWGGCIAQILASEHPTIRAINPRTWVRRTNYREIDFQPSLRAFLDQRNALVDFLRSLEPEDWQRTARVTGAGKPLVRSVEFYARWLARHERSHLKPIARLAQAARGQA